MPNDSIAPFTVGEVVLTSLEALLSAAALHLGEAMPDGRALAQRDPQEAWFAILAVSGMLNTVGPMMNEATRESLTKRHAALVARFAELHPDAEFPVPEAIARAFAEA